MAQAIKCLPQKHKECSWDPKNPHQAQEVAAYNCNPSSEGNKWSLEHIGQSTWPIWESRSSETQKRWGGISEASQYLPHKPEHLGMIPQNPCEGRKEEEGLYTPCGTHVLPQTWRVAKDTPDVRLWRLREHACTSTCTCTFTCTYTTLHDTQANTLK